MTAERALPATLDPAPAAFGAEMVRRFGPLWHALGLGRGVGRTRLEDHAADRVRDAVARGPVIFVLPRASTLDYLALNAALASRRLPLSAWAPGVRTGCFKPLGEAWRDARARLGDAVRGRLAADPVESGWVARALGAGEAVTLFLEDRAWSRPTVDPFAAVVEAARLDPPVQVLPLLVVWDRSPEVDTPLYRFFRASGVPGTARRVWHALSSADAFVQVGEPIELPALAERVGRERLPGVLRRMVARSLRQARKVVAGPRLLPHRVLRRLVLDNPPMRELAREEAARLGVGAEAVRATMARDYDRIAARFSWTVIRLLHLVLRPLWTRVFDGVDARPEDLERIRAAMRDGTAVLVPCHKSHFDYVLLSWVMYDADLIVPHVVAGLNLAVWPVSLLLRGAGGFFVKRSFAGDRIFPAVFARYVRELVLQEYPIEFFVEGGRTRSGKLLPPKLGVLGMVLDAAEVRSHGREVTILPVALAYEQVAEEGAYARELGGEKKRAETLGDLVRARSVLSRRFGRVYLRVGEPVALGALVDAREERVAWSEREPAERKAELQALGERVVHRIGREVVLLPTSLVAVALLALPRRAVLHSELTARIARFDALFRRLGVHRAAALERFDQAVAQSLARFVRDGRIEALERGSDRVWSIVPDERITLDFYKNQVLHLLAPAGVAACALRAAGDGAPVEVLAEPALALRRLWRRELVWDPDEPAEDALRRGLADLDAHGAVASEGGGWRVASVERIGEVYGLFRALLEGYDAALRGELWAPAAAADAPAALRAAEARLVASGAITRPEALSVAKLQNAIATLTEDGALRARPDGRLEPDPERAEAARAFLRRLL